MKNCVIFKGIFIGFKCITLLYIADSLSCITDINLILIFFIFGLINGFIDALLLIKSTTINRILFYIVGILATILIFLLSLYLSLPNLLADYFVYGEGGGGLEPGGALAFMFFISIYFGTSLIIGFPTSIILLSKDWKNRVF